MAAWNNRLLEEISGILQLKSPQWVVLKSPRWWFIESVHIQHDACLGDAWLCWWGLPHSMLQLIYKITCQCKCYLHLIKNYIISSAYKFLIYWAASLHRKFRYLMEMGSFRTTLAIFMFSFRLWFVDDSVSSVFLFIRPGFEDNFSV